MKAVVIIMHFERICLWMEERTIMKCKIVLTSFWFIYLFLTILEMFCFSTRIWSSCYVSWWSYRPDWNGQRCLYPKLCRRRKRGCYWWSVLYTRSYVFSMVIWRVIGSLECVTGGYATDDDIKNKCSWKSHFLNHLHLEGRASTKY